MTDTPEFSRRDLLQATGTLAVAGTSFTAGCSVLQRDPDAATADVTDEEARRLAERYAPVLYFDAAEKWYPTDPRPYERERDGDPVVDGFDAFDGYARRSREADGPPDPTLFYHVRAYEDSPLAAVQYWWYGAFDQFSVNFHWHDWEVVHVFVNREADEPELFVASAHSRKVPNNEFVDPERTVPRVLSELGSHSSALSVNDIPDRFQRLPTDDTFADITNRALEASESLAAIPAAYGLPRDEGFRLPFLVPELDGRPVYEDDRLPSVERSSLVAPDLTVRSFSALTSPPADLPERETGAVFGFEGDRNAADADVDVGYDLVPTAELEHITAFTGPQLSFEFAVPDFAEDLVSGHITTTGLPWEQARYENPAADISEPAHRQALAERYDAIGDPAPINRVVAAVRRTDENEDAPDGEGVTTEQTTVETVARLESDPEAVPSFAGTVVVDDVPAGDHRLTVNGAGYAPHSERVTLSDGPEPTRAGVDGDVALTANEQAVKVRVDAEGTDADLRALAVEDDFAGRLYDAPLDGRDAVYVDRRGAYTTEVRDADDEVGAFRVNPADEAATTIENPRTGKASLATFLSAIADETGTEVRAAGGQDGDDGDDDDDTAELPPSIRGLAHAFDAAAAAAARAADAAEDGDAAGADQRLEVATENLQRAGDSLLDARGDLPGSLVNAVERRLEQADRRAEQALDADKL